MQTPTEKEALNKVLSNALTCLVALQAVDVLVIATTTESLAFIGENPG